MFTEYLSNGTPNFFGCAVGLCSILIIALWHPIVIKGEYYFGKWPCIIAFSLSGIITLYLSATTANLFYSMVLAFWGFVSLWSVVEVPLQQKRVAKGYFPKKE